MASELFGYLLTEEEEELCKEIIIKKRKEEERERFIYVCSHEIECAINFSIEQIGISETAEIVKMFDRKLRRKEREEKQNDL